MVRMVWSDRNFVAKSWSFFGIKRVIVGALHSKLPISQQFAVEMHEVAHCHFHHIEKRWLCLLMNPWNYSRLCKQQEFDADRYAAERGHAQGLIDFLRDENEESFLYPSHSERRQHLKQYV